MGRSGSKKVIYFYNNSGSLDGAIKFLENTQKKINYIDLNINMEGNNIKIILYGSKDLQYLACERLKELAQQFL
ncbi:MAG: hypothetical protein ACTSRI_12020 [Promethearchaeota archaeon]